MVKSVEESIEGYSRSVKFGASMDDKQGEFFALQTVVEYPDFYNSADAWGRVEAIDTQNYVVKGIKGGKFVPACELLSTRLAESVNLPCPTAKIVELQSGDLVFGSRIIGGLSDAVETSTLLTTPTVSNAKIMIPGMQSLLSEVYAFDMYINNIDRHDYNFLSVDDRGTRRFYIFDFSRSLFWNSTPFGFPQPNQPTVHFGRILRKLHGFDLASALAMLDKLGAIPEAAIQSILRGIPDGWLASSKKQVFVDEWRKRDERIERLRKGFTDGSLL